MGSLLCLRKQRPYDKERGEKRHPELVMAQKFMQVDMAPMFAWASQDAGHRSPGHLSAIPVSTRPDACRVVCERSLSLTLVCIVTWLSLQR